jgi:hypothetical protein
VEICWNPLLIGLIGMSYLSFDNYEGGSFLLSSYTARYRAAKTGHTDAILLNRHPAVPDAAKSFLA